MGLKLDTVAHMCNQISGEINSVYKNLSMNFVIYHEGQHMDAANITRQEIMAHPAASKAMKLLKNIKNTKQSSYIGTAIENKTLLCGISSQEVLLSLFTLNIDQFKDVKDIRAYAYHCAWHALKALETIDTPAYKIKAQSSFVLPKKEKMEILSENMKADAFSAIMCYMSGDKMAPKRLASMRGQNVLSKHIGCKPEDYPFALALATTEFAIKEYFKGNMPKKKRISTALMAANEIGDAFDKAALRQWTDFSLPAQSMAWKGYGREHILGSAIYIAHDTYVRSAGHLVSDMTGVKPTTLLETRDTYSDFAQIEDLEELHLKKVEKTLDEVIIKSIEEDSSSPFTEEANKQNLSLTDGNIFGWCAFALQEAAKVVENAINNGQEIEEMSVRERFHETQSSLTWKQLVSLSRQILKKCRAGYEMTFDSLMELCGTGHILAPVKNSVYVTNNDPNFIQRLEATNSFMPRSSAKATPSKTTEPKSSPAAAPSVTAQPGVGGSTSAAVAVNHTVSETGEEERA
jgi:hypothetical protein